MQEIHVVENPKGTFSCNLDITADEWKQILSDSSFTTDNYKKALLAFYNEPDHRSNCQSLSIKYYGNEIDAQKFNSWITKFGQAIVKRLNRFHIIDEDNKERFWHVTMCYGTKQDNGWFITQLRPELVEAIEALGWNRHCTWIPFYMEMADKLLNFKNNRNELLDIVYELGSNSVGYIKDSNGGRVSDIDPFTVFGIFNRGINEENRKSLIKYFKEKLDISADIPSDFDGIPVVNNMMGTFFWREYIGTDVQPLWELFEAILDKDEPRIKSCFDKVCKQRGIKWNITMGLFWIRPYDYISLDSCNREYLPSLGIDVFKECDIDSEHYFELLSKVHEKLDGKELEVNNIPEISYRAWHQSSNTDINIWFARDANIEDFNECIESHCLFFNNGNKFGDMNDLGDDIKSFSKSLGESKVISKSTVHYTYWQLSHKVKENDIIIYFKTPKEVLAWGYVNSSYIYDESRKHHHSVGVDWNKVDNLKDSPVKHSSGLWFKDKKFNEARLLLEALGIELKNNDKIDNNNNTMKYQKYIELLKENHNLILTGAPGTGKTYMAKAITEEMGAETEFVQFHPSYDYTDFVEGLRPIEKGEDQVGFRRMDGIFKKFCKKAILNEAAEDNNVLNKLNSDPKVWKVSLGGTYENPTRTDCLNNGYIRIGWHEYGDVDDFNDYQDFSVGGRTILRAFQTEMKVGDLIVSCYSQYETDAIGIVTGDYEYRGEGGEFPRYRTVEWIIRDIRVNIQDVLGKKMTLSTIYKLNVSVPEILKLVKENGGLKEQPAQKDKPYVMIIDEINRGELSKIFGELFFAIDPGYRGEKGRVNTQYQNLVDEGDVFEKGFYVPDNVYILATMNDIDRSVESMDFAMRRRFTWEEITPSDTMDDMLNSKLGNTLATSAKAYMQRLNDKIAETDGLGEAFMIGPSYFLKLEKYEGDFKKLWRLNIRPLLKEYLRGFRKADDKLNDFEKVYFNNKSDEAEIDKDVVVDDDEK